MTSPTPLKQRVLAAARRQPSPPRRPRRAWLPAGVAALAMAAVYALWGDPGRAAGRPLAVGAWIVLGVAVLAVTGTRLLLPRRSMLPPATVRLLAVALGVPAVVAAWLLAWHAAYPDPFTQLGLRCFALTMALAPWPFVALARAAPYLLPDRPWILGAALGSGAGAWAAVVVEVWCPLADPRHVAIGHVAPLVALAVVGAALGPWLLRRRGLAA